MSRILGLLRDSLLLAIFGNRINDVFFAAYRFPNLFRRIFGEGALSACFLPLYVEYKEKKDRAALAQLTGGVLGLLMIVLIPFTILVILTMDNFLPWMMSGEGFTSVPGKMEMMVTMSRIMFPFLPLVSLYAFFMAVLNANKKFLLSSLAPSLFNLSMVAASVWCWWLDSTSIVVLSLSVLLGGLLQFLILLPALKGMDVPFNFSWSSITSEPVQRVLRAFMPTVLGLGIVQFMGFINTSFASWLPEGSITYISAGDRLLELPLSLVAVSLGTAMLPNLSASLSLQQYEPYKKELFRSLKVVIFLCLPAAVGLWMIAEPLVAVLFQRGEFTADKTLIVAGVVRVYSFTLIAASISRIMSQAFFAEGRTQVPAVASLCGLILHVCLAPFMMKQYGIYGLVASTSIAAFANSIYLMVAFTLRHGTLYYGELLVFIGKCAIASLAIAAICAGLGVFLREPTSLNQSLWVALGVGLSVPAYFFIAMSLKMREAHQLYIKIRRRF